MNITGTSSYIRVKLENDHEIIINGELVVGGFIALKSSIKSWEPPYDHEIISEDDKKSLMKRIENKTKGSHMVISFE